MNVNNTLREVVYNTPPPRSSLHASSWSIYAINMMMLMLVHSNLFCALYFLSGEAYVLVEVLNSRYRSVMT